MNFIYHIVLNACAGLFLFVSIMGIPGNPDESNKRQQLILTLWGYILVIAFRGIPFLALGALVAFLLKYDTIASLCSVVNFLLGLSLFLLVLGYYGTVKNDRS